MENHKRKGKGVILQSAYISLKVYGKVSTVLGKLINVLVVCFQIYNKFKDVRVGKKNQYEGKWPKWE